MDKNQNHPSAPQPASATSDSSSREQQAREIMQQLVTEGIFSPDEAAEVTFSDTAFICIPDTGQEPADKKGVK
ncbi:hypothetical protein F070042J6_20200 [Bacteroides sp. f07]